MINWKNGRPDDWENPYMSGDPFTGPIFPSTQALIYEAGAGALLEALKKGGKYFKTLDAYVEIGGEMIVPRHREGYVVFIEEAK